MNKIWIGNGQLVLPDKIVPGGSVLLEGKKIAAVNVPCPPDARRVDVDGSYIMAGFVDIHVHGGGDSDFMDEDASAFPTIAKAHCAHGTTALCPTTMTCADSLLEKTIDLFLEADKEPENGAELLGLHLEGPYFSAASKGAQPIGEQRIPEREDLERILRRAKGSILRWDAAPELPNMELFAKVMAENGVLASLAHSAATAPHKSSAPSWAGLSSRSLMPLFRPGPTVRMRALHRMCSAESTRPLSTGTTLPRMPPSIWSGAAPCSERRFTSRMAYSSTVASISECSRPQNRSVSCS